MRTRGVAALLLLALVQRVGAQSGQRPHGTTAPSTSTRHGASHAPPASVHPAPPSVPSPARPRPSSFPQRSLTPEASPRLEPASPFDAGPFTYAPRYKPWRRPRPLHNWGSGYGYALPFEVVEASPETPRASADEEQPRIGGVDLDVEPRNAAVYVDGFYIGTLGDFAADGLPLRSGRHWIDLRAEGYETLTIPVDVLAGQLATYHGALTVARPPQASTASSRGTQTMFVIPGCYAGNRPPVESTLPKGCDIATLRTLTMY